MVRHFLWDECINKSSDKFIRIISNPKDENSLINDNINSFIEDRSGKLWIGTRDGLSIYNRKLKRFHNYSTENGLPDNNIMDISKMMQANFG